MSMKCCIPLLFMVTISLISCKPAELETPQESAEIASLDFAKLAQKMVELTEIQSAEGVLLVMEPGDFNPIIDEIKKQVEAKGGSYLGALSISDHQPDEWSTDFTKRCENVSEEELRQLFEEVDLGIMLPGATPADLPYKLLQDMLQSESRRTIHFHWAGAYDLNGNLLSMDDEIGSFYQNVVLNTDYNQLASAQVDFEDAMRNNEIQVTTEAGTDIRFSIGDRPVTKQDGNASASRAMMGKNLIDREIEIPSGAIRVAPIESSVNGTIAFPDALWDDEEVNGLKVQIENGKIVNVEAEKGRDAVLREMEKAGEAGSSFREFALGFNPLMPIQQVHRPWIPYYGYGAGVVRLSLGDNTELGGKVTGGYVRWNFFPNATVTVGEEVWVDNGTLVK